jgi:hypothetical protein
LKNPQIGRSRKKGSVEAGAMFEIIWARGDATKLTGWQAVPEAEAPSQKNSKRLSGLYNCDRSEKRTFSTKSSAERPLPVRCDNRAGGLTPAMRRRSRTLSAVLRYVRTPDMALPAILVNPRSRPSGMAHPIAIPTATGLTVLFLRWSRNQSARPGGDNRAVRRGHATQSLPKPHQRHSKPPFGRV